MEKNISTQSLLSKIGIYNLMLIGWLFLLFIALYFISPSLINFFIAILTLLFIVGCNILYTLLLVFISILVNKIGIQFKEKYIFRNFLKVNIIISYFLSVMYVIVLLIPKL
jgi:hypothetical protein